MLVELRYFLYGQYLLPISVQLISNGKQSVTVIMIYYVTLRQCGCIRSRLPNNRILVLILLTSSARRTQRRICRIRRYAMEEDRPSEAANQEISVSLCVIGRNRSIASNSSIYRRSLSQLVYQQISFGTQFHTQRTSLQYLDPGSHGLVER